MKNIKTIFTKKNILFVVIFTALGLIALQIPFTNIVGSKAKFTLFDFMGPMSSGFIGTVPGVIAVLLTQVLNFLLHGAQIVDAGTIIRFFPMLFATWYFSQKSRWNIVIPLLAMIAFSVHPIGRTCWTYSLFWLIPILCYFARGKFLLARALGATFTAHAIGSTLWLYVFELPRETWIFLVPVVIKERFLFAIGITVAYLVFTNVLNFLCEKKYLQLDFLLDRRYVFGGKKNLPNENA